MRSAPKKRDLRSRREKTLSHDAASGAMVTQRWVLDLQIQLLHAPAVAS